MRSKSALMLLAALGAGVAAAQTAQPVIVGSKLATEGTILGQMILLLLEDAGIQATDKTALGDTRTNRSALLAGEIHLYPEYTGTALSVFFPQENIPADAARNAARSYETVRRLDAKNGVTWLRPAPANNTWALAITQDFARKNNLKSLADFARYVNDGKPVKVIGSPEFFNRPDSFRAFEAGYGFELRPEQKLVLAGAATPQTEAAVARGTNGVNAAMAYGTDGSLDALKLVVLTDPRGVQPVYQPAVTVRSEILRAYPQMEGLLNAAFGKLNQRTLQALNGRVAIEGRNPREVAREFLRAQGLLK